MDPALEKAHALQGVDPAVLYTLELQRARVDFGLFRPDLAAPRAAAIFENRNHLPAELRENARQLSVISKALIARPWWPEAKAQIAGGAKTNGAIANAASSTERDAVNALLEGRAALAAGKSSDALRLLGQAESSGALPEGWVGPCRLLAGQAADLTGDRARAVAYYKRAEQTPGFLAREAAIDYQSRPFAAGGE